MPRERNVSSEKGIAGEVGGNDLKEAAIRELKRGYTPTCRAVKQSRKRIEKGQ